MAAGINMLWVLEILVLAMHFGCVALAIGLPGFAWVDDLSRLRSGRAPGEKVGADGSVAPETKAADQQCGRLLGEVVGWHIATALSGLGVGWLAWNAGLPRALSQVGSRVPFAIVEFCFSLALLGLCGWWMRRWPGVGPRVRLWRGLVLAVALSNLIYHFPSLFAVVGELRSQPDRTSTLTSAEFRGMLFRWRIVWVGLHVVAAAGITSGLYLLTNSSPALAWWRPNRLRATIGGALVLIWISGWGLQIHQARAELAWMYSPQQLSWTFAWMLSLIATTASLVGVVAGARSRGWIAASWGLLGFTFWSMAAWARGG